MFLVRFDLGEKWTSRFYIGVALFAMAGICLMLVPDRAIEVVTAPILVLQ